MAKLTLRNASEIARATRDRTDEDGWTMRDFLVLRSDEKVLGKTDIRSPHSSYWNRTSYSIRGSLAPKDGRTSLERFQRFAEQRGYTVK